MDVIPQRDGSLRAGCSDCGREQMFMQLAPAWTWVLDHECAPELPVQRVVEESTLQAG